MRPLPGISADVVDNDGNPITEGQGLLVLRRPWPGMLRTLYKDPDRLYRHLLAPVRSRHVSGRRCPPASTPTATFGSWDASTTSSTSRAPAVNRRGRVGDRQPSKVAEAAVVAEQDELTGQAIVAFVTPVEGTDTEGMDQELRDHVAEMIGKLARPKRIIWTYDLPKTRSGKIMRRLLRTSRRAQPGRCHHAARPCSHRQIARDHRQQSDTEG